MTDDDYLSIRVAELCGWKDIEDRKGQGTLYGRRPPEYNGWSILPLFSTDLNAMHDAVNSLTDAQYDCFCDYLWNLCDGASGKTGAINATARQRAEAFVRWMEE